MIGLKQFIISGMAKQSQQLKRLVAACSYQKANQQCCYCRIEACIALPLDVHAATSLQFFYPYVQCQNTMKLLISFPVSYSYPISKHINLCLYAQRGILFTWLPSCQGILGSPGIIMSIHGSSKELLQSSNFTQASLLYHNYWCTQDIESLI